MRLKFLALGLMIAGVVILLSSFYLSISFWGSCPPFGSCDHTLTVWGITFWIGRTAKIGFVWGVLTLLLGMATGVYSAVQRLA